MSWRTGQKDGSTRSGVVTVLDVGSSKVCCVIAKLKPTGGSQLLKARTHKIQIIGIGHQKSQGVKSGVVVDLDKVEQTVRQCVDAAERMAGLTVDSLIVNLSAGRLRSEKFSASINLGGHEVLERDIDKVLAAGAKQALKVERQVIHSLPVAFSLDEERGIQDPRGMVGDALGVDMHVLTGDLAPQRNLEAAINRSHLSVERMVATPYASGLAALVDDELQMGAACIDLGGGTTSISVFNEGRFVFADAIPVGGNHVTMDLARGLSVRLEDAERLKVIHSSALPGSSDEYDTVSVNSISGDPHDAPLQVPRSAIARIVRARVEETLEMLRDRLAKSGQGAVVGKRIVLTGGASQLVGLPEAARRILGRNVRVGRPLGVSGLPEASKGPAFSTVAGLLIYPQVASFESADITNSMRTKLTGTGGRFQRVSQWIKDSF